MYLLSAGCNSNRGSTDGRNVQHMPRHTYCRSHESILPLWRLIDILFIVSCQFNAFWNDCLGAVRLETPNLIDFEADFKDDLSTQDSHKIASADGTSFLELR